MKYVVATARPIAEDLAGTLAFYILFVVTGSVLIGALVGLSIGIAQVTRHRIRHEEIPPILTVGVLLTMVLGGATVLSHDPRFLMIKPTILYAAIAIPMFRRGWVIRYVPEIARDLLDRRTFDRVGRGWAALMLMTAATNLALVLALPPRTAAIAFTAVAVLGKVVLFAGQYTVLRRRARRAHDARAAS